MLAKVFYLLFQKAEVGAEHRGKGASQRARATKALACNILIKEQRILMWLFSSRRKHYEVRQFLKIRFYAHTMAKFQYL